jgi:1,5-anhydro-D-fructose reductase (1,5-anhydro-D-mannitol-forming)
MKKLNIAILGTGSIAAGGHAPALLQTEHAQLWSVLSRDPARAEKFAAQFKAHAGSAAHTSLESLLADPELDAVIVATPDKLHSEQTVAAAKSGKHVLLEKPLATDADGIAQIIESCSRSKITLALCYRLRWHAGHRAIVDAVRAGRFGDLHHVRSLWTSQETDTSNWRASPEVGRWWSLGAMGTHLVDLSRWILQPTQGEMTQTKSVIARENWQGSHDETAVAVFKFEGGATAEICTSVLFDAPSRLEIYGSKGWAICEGTFGREAAGRIWTNDGEFAFPVVNPFVEMIEDFVQAIHQRRKPEVDVVEGARNAQILMELVKEERPA